MKFLIVAAIVVLVLSITPASATQVTLHYQSNQYGPYTLADPITVQVTVPGGTDPTITASFFNNSALQPESLYVFVCRALTPQQCATSVSPTQYSFSLGRKDLSFTFSSIRDSPVYPQTGNMLFIVTTTNPSITKAYWHPFQKLTSGSSVTDVTSELGSLDVFLNDIGQQALVENSVKNDGVIPAGSIVSVTFNTATGFYELLSDALPSLSSAFTSSSQLFTPISKALDLVFPVTGGVNQAVTIVQSSSGGYCGDSACNNGETQSSCCFDCGCSGDSYCDTANVCKSNGAVTLQIIPPTDTRVSNCNQAHTITLIVQLTSPPSDMQVLAQRALLDGSMTQSLSCTANGNIFTCPVNVPADPACGSGTFVYSPNSISFDIAYTDAGTSVSRTLTTSFPDITIGSWTCGNGLAEESLGETNANCCFDVACSTGQYCNLATGANPLTGVCSAIPSSVQFFSVTPSSFSSYSSAGNALSFSYDIVSTPKSFSTVETCDALCVSDQPCTSSCSVTCSPTATGGTCSLSFTIAGYDPSRGYAVSPQLNVQVTHPNGAGFLTEHLTGTLPRYAFGASFCGDGTCNGNENYGNCCFDCLCPDGQFCSTASTVSASPGDTCSVQDIRFVIDQTDTPVFIDQAISHTLGFTAHLDNLPPHGVTIEHYSCSLFDGDIACVATCTAAPQIGTRQDLSCELSIPPVSSPGLDMVILNGNTIGATISYSSGIHFVQQDVFTSLPTIQVTQIYHCGMDGCEASLGETYANCCIDCPCTDDPVHGTESICVPGGDVPTSACVLVSSLSAALSTPPKDVTCQILPPQTGRGCQFAETSVFEFQLTNAPASTQFASTNVLYLGNVSPVTCDPVVSGKFKCYLLHPTIPEPPGSGGYSGIPGGTEVRDVRFLFDAVYEDHQIIATKKLTVDTQITVKRDDRQIQSCEQQAHKQDKHIRKNNVYKNIATAILIVIWAIVVYEAIRCVICLVEDTECEIDALGVFLESETSCTETLKSGWVATCVTAIVLPLYSSADGAIKKAKEEKAAICAAPDTASLGAATSGAGISNLQWVQVGATAICLIGAIGGGGGGGGGSGIVSAT